jgi:hypothetical protein
MTFAFVSSGVAWLAVVAAVAAAAALFLIRPRPPRLVVSSLVIWQRVLDEARDRSLWDRIRWWVSLGVTMTIAAALALALLRPEPAGAGAGAPARVLLVIDSSWTMLARTPAGETRWDRAIAAARARARASGGAAVCVATTAEGVVQGPTSDRTLVASALDRLRPSGAVDGAWPRVANVDAVHLFTDGARARVVPEGVTVESVFVPAANVAVTTLDVVARDSGQADVFVAVVNHARTSQTVQLVVTRGAEAIVDRSLAIAAGASARESLVVPMAGEPRFHARVTARDNAMTLDDEAAVWFSPSRPRTIAVVGTASVIPKLVAADPSFRVLSVQPEGYSQTKADIWIFDRWLPSGPPAGPSLFIDPPSSPWFGARAGEELGPVWQLGQPHAVVEGVDLAYLEVARAHAINRPSLQTIVRSEKGLPLVAIEDSPSARYVVIGVSTLDSNLASTSAFPVLIGNSIDWLGRPSIGARRAPGPVVLPLATSRLIGPDGRAWPFVKRSDRTVATLTAPGLYLADVLGSENVVAVRSGDPSNLLVSAVAEATPSSSPIAAGRPWWTLLAIAALVMVVGEWWTWQRRVTV